NFNNDIGVPLTLLRLSQHDDFAVIEMGANHLGEIAYTTELVKPDIAIINNIAAAHLEGFGDLCGVAKAKGEIFTGLVQNGIALYSKESKYASKWQWRLADKQVHTFSCHHSVNADVSSHNVSLDQHGCAHFDLHTNIGQCAITLPIPGKHNVCNAVAASAAAIECGASLRDIRLGLAGMDMVKGRLNIHQLSENLTLIDDTYNANVDSIKAAIALLANYSGQRILVLGDMAELGQDAHRYHQEVGEYAKEQGINVLYTLGLLSQNTHDAFALKNSAISEHFSDRSELSTQLLLLIEAQTQKNHCQILVKGSRSAYMESVVEDVISWHTNQYKNQHQNQYQNNNDNQSQLITSHLLPLIKQDTP
ncbi:MAG: UDP-N-acetylmuramoyl-tripeptide--D-alanyl-D-alanine ligase, partial [Colwellia sp.]|nr:UDP-N-acetylmuramoyl-tripeptide--D-alanyl-D-alanine ligase [Colwellia sp.]